MDSNFVKR
ncbi:hypothetical protein AT2G35343 [Arabidopsis thaliana]|uniref:Uncharacterized protein n=1 Tax=Arabidopsis thaliana TaxID=3702 RepID=A0A1P8AXK3_ARATH|nr:uncharacterized protein AT2G35343 [Arabidopsis thaliana]ANM61365.1 hypothetical protein AT2G35343 [Arabidopsis thaliana]|eukprot:NP_001336516.1 hypothetical protein AT2G35343 [Arabidopsis thaliana]